MEGLRDDAKSENGQRSVKLKNCLAWERGARRGAQQSALAGVQGAKPPEFFGGFTTFSNGKR